MVTTNIVELSLLNEGPNMRLLEVFNLVLICSSKVGTHAAVVASDDDTALASGLDIVDTVFCVDTSLLTSLFKDICILIAANATNVENGIFREDVL